MIPTSISLFSYYLFCFIRTPHIVPVEHSIVKMNEICFVSWNLSVFPCITIIMLDTLTLSYLKRHGLVWIAYTRSTGVFELFISCVMLAAWKLMYVQRNKIPAFDDGRLNTIFMYGNKKYENKMYLWVASLMLRLDIESMHGSYYAGQNHPDLKS